MTTRRTVLQVEQLGARVLPSTTVAAAPSSTTTVTTTTVHPFGQAWTAQGRFSLSSTSTGAKTYTLQGSADLGGSNFYSVTGTITTVGSKAGQATGKVVLTSPKGTLTLTLAGPTQPANSKLPTSVTYKVVSGTGAFAHYAGQGSMQTSATFFIESTDHGQFSLKAAVPVGATPTPTPTPSPTPAPAPGPSSTTTGPSWTGQGRYTLANATGGTKTYTLQGSADFGSNMFFAVSGTVTSVGTKAGQATGRVTLNNPRGMLTLSLVGPTQSANSKLPPSFTYKVLSGTGFFAHYVGQGTFQLAASLFSGYTDKGHFAVAVKPTSK
jgi:hypothetical protein